MPEDTEQQEQRSTVGGVEPSVRLCYLANANPGDNTQSIKLFPFDDGGPREIVRNGGPVLVTVDELHILTTLGTFEQVAEEEVVEEPDNWTPEVVDPSDEPISSSFVPDPTPPPTEPPPTSDVAFPDGGVAEPGALTDPTPVPEVADSAVPSAEEAPAPAEENPAPVDSALGADETQTPGQSG